MRIAVVSSEGAPYIKSGGLGDVMEALPAALDLAGIQHGIVGGEIGKVGAINMTAQHPLSYGVRPTTHRS